MELDLLKWEKSESLLPDKEDLKRLELWVIKAAWLKIKKHMKWEKVDTKLKEIWDIVRDGLWEKENKKEETIEPFKNFIIRDVWEWKDIDN